MINASATTQKPKRILYVITKSNFGGAQKYVYELAVAARDAGYEVAVAAGGTGAAGAASGLLLEKLETAHIPVFLIKNFMRDMSLLHDYRAFYELHTIIGEYKPDILHITSSKAGGIGALAGRMRRVPRIIFTSHGLTMDEIWRPRWQRLLITIATWITLRLSNHSIMISTETYERARRLWGIKSRVSLIFNGLTPFSLLDRAAARAALAPNLPTDTFWLGGIGELHPNKNWSAAISTLPLLPSSVHLVIIGIGEEHSLLTATARELGVQDRCHIATVPEGAARYLSAFDTFILPSKKEGLPYVLLEAGHASVPVIASDLPGNHDIVISGETGYLIEPTPANIAHTLTPLLTDPTLRTTLGTALHTAVQKKFSHATMCTQTFACYEANTSRGL